MAAWLDSLNGITIAYAMGLVNALLGLVLSFGVTLSADQRSYIVAAINAALVFVAHVSHRVAVNKARTTPSVNG